MFDDGAAAFNSLPQTAEDSAFCAQSTEFHFIFLLEPEAVYHFDGQEDFGLFFQTGDVSLPRTLPSGFARLSLAGVGEAGT